MTDNINHPEHYTQHPSGVECIQITEHMGFCVGNAIKYLWRHEQKGGVEDLKKAKWYIDREIKRKDQLPGPLGDHSERTAARPSLADLVDWERAPDFAQWAAQDNTGEIFWYEREPYLDGDRKKWLNMCCQCTFFDERPLAHDWQTPLKRPNSNQGCSSEHKHQSFTDEKPGYLYRHIPVTKQEDEEWESKAPSDVPPLARRYNPKHG